MGLWKRARQLCERNRELTRRVRTAATRYITSARIILQAADSIADDKMVSLSLDASKSPPPRHKSLLDMPYEVLSLILRYVWEDIQALSKRQWTALEAHAAERSSILKAAHVWGGLDRYKVKHVIGDQWWHRKRDYEPEDRGYYDDDTDDDNDYDYDVRDDLDPEVVEQKRLRDGKKRANLLWLRSVGLEHWECNHAGEALPQACIP